MKLHMSVLALICLAVSSALAQKDFGDDLIARLEGEWTMTGTIAGQQVVHDLEARWILQGYYLQIHELARGRDDEGNPLYEAVVTIGWEPDTGEYVCQWLDSTGGTGLRDGFFGRGKRDGDSIPFVFGDEESAIHNTFTYHPDTDRWSWAIDNVRGGEHRPFARVALERKREE